LDCETKPNRNAKVYIRQAGKNGKRSLFAGRQFAAKDVLLYVLVAVSWDQRGDWPALTMRIW
jgi:hypothetical protein